MTQENHDNITLLIGELKGEMKGVKDAMKTMADNMGEFSRAFNELEKGRLSKLEIQFANLIGKLTIIAIIVSAIVSFLSVLLQRYLFKL